MNAINRTYLFDRIRQSVFGGSLTQLQVEGVTRILDYREENWPKMSDDELAYLLASVVHETGHQMQPINEFGSEQYLRGKDYYPWIGRGLIQITWSYNYEKFGIKRAEDALKWPVALDIAFRGMVKGMFTGRRLSNYIGGGKVNYVEARRIVNGTDRAKLIAGYAHSFRDALRQSRQKVAA